jgi:hypothetical protein
VRCSSSSPGTGFRGRVGRALFRWCGRLSGDRRSAAGRAASCPRGQTWRTSVQQSASFARPRGARPLAPLIQCPSASGAWSARPRPFRGRPRRVIHCAHLPFSPSEGQQVAAMPTRRRRVGADGAGARGSPLQKDKSPRPLLVVFWVKLSLEPDSTRRGQRDGVRYRERGAREPAIVPPATRPSPVVDHQCEDRS